jgi:hypothetical protein
MLVRGRGQALAAPPDPDVPGTPTLTVVEPVTNPPTFYVDLDYLWTGDDAVNNIIVNDIIRRQITLAADTGFASPVSDASTQLITSDLTSREIGEVDYTAIAAETYIARCRVERPGQANSAWSTTTASFAVSAVAVLSSLVGTGTSTTTASIDVSTTHDNGSLYWVVTTSATPPTRDQVLAGLDHTGAAAVDSGSQTVTATGAQSITGGAGPLNPDTAFRVHMVHQASVGVSAVATSAEFSTQASSAGPPVPTYRTSAISALVSGFTYAASGVNIVTAAENLLLVIAINIGNTRTLVSGTVTPSGGSPIAMTILSPTSPNGRTYLAQAAIPNGTNLTNATVTVVLTNTTGVFPIFDLWTVPTDDLEDTTPVDVQRVQEATSNAPSVDLNAFEGGMIIGISYSADTTSNTAIWSGDENFTEARAEGAFSFRSSSPAHASGVGADAASTVTVTWVGDTGVHELTAASWR